jgi:hypothetical protein
MNNWIEWRGGTCPVHESTIVDVRFRDGYEDSWTHNSTADSWEWRHGCGKHTGEDVVAYRVVEPHFLEALNTNPLPTIAAHRAQ